MQSSLPHHERITDPAFRQAVDLLDAGDAAALGDLLKETPELVTQQVCFEDGNYFRHPTLLEFAAENPVRRGTLPTNIVQVAGVIIAAGASTAALQETLLLVATGRVPRECDVQTPLLELLCTNGADPARATHAAAFHGEIPAVNALLRLGAPMDVPVAAALGRTEAFRILIRDATPLHRHLALALASQLGHAAIVSLLLDAGDNPDRYNPPGGHAHATPLHQAAWYGHKEVVQLFLNRGARLDLRDTIWHGTPADWASHAGHQDLAQLLEPR